MATSSILGAQRAPVQSNGRDTDALGPSDTSDSGSDVQDERGFDALDEGEIGGDRADLSSDTDSSGTGERGAAVRDTDAVEGADIAPDRIGVFSRPTAAEDIDDLGDPEAVDLDSLAADPADEDDDGTPALDDDDDTNPDRPGTE